ncbi:TetR/AcrR family transcriptional regulator [Saccharothrix lopnurensis]|uniref:TetR family transcriptional regulator n=1 Tax=Saccharothrix lopnurensis TaxID=1670621 RepID=A0ABW1P455_9PSEU
MEFQRARRPEQVEQRRRAILEAARALLREQPLADISLRELSCRVGLAKSNVLRYFDSREAVFLEVLDEEWGAWLDALDAEPPTGDEAAVATALASSLAGRRTLAELFGHAGVLERNITVERARRLKGRAATHSTRLADLVRALLPVLDEDAARHFADAVVVLAAGLWPRADPTEAVARALRELGSPEPAELFATGLAEALVNQLAGLVARSTRD